MKTKGVLANIVCGVLGLALSAYVWISTYSFPVDKISVVGSDYFPRLLAFGLAASSLTMLVTTIVSKREEIFETLNPKDPGIQRAIICLLSTILYVALLKPVGFIPVSILYLFGIMVLLKKRNWIVMAVLSAVLPIGVYLAFLELLGISLPVGILSFILY